MNYLLIGEETERLSFRELRECDFVVWLDFCKQEDSLKYIWLSESEDPKVRCRAWFDRVFARYQSGRGGMNILLEKKTGQVVGQCGLLVQVVDGVEELEVGYSIMPEFRRMGYSIEAAKRCRNFAFQNQLRSSVISIINDKNERSKRTAMRNGMKLDSKTFYNHASVEIFRINYEDWIENQQP